jgi:uncharacterized membrane protein
MNKQTIGIPQTTHLLALLSAAAIFLFICRQLATQSLTGLFWIWNLFLAWIPLWVVLWLRDRVQKKAIGKISLATGIILWLFFFPNAPYIITDLIHLKESPSSLIWYDALMGFTFAMSGLFTGMYSVLWVHRIIFNTWGQIMAFIVIPFCLLLSGYGIYLGRFGRWNSWDVVSDPLALCKYVLRSVRNPLAIQTTLAFSFVMLLTYAIFYLFSQKKQSIIHK